VYLNNQVPPKSMAATWLDRNITWFGTFQCHRYLA